MTFGLLSTGFIPKRQEDVEAAIRAAIAVAPQLGANLNTDPESPLGQFVVIVAAALAEGWSQAEAINVGLLSASGVQLDSLVQIYRLTRNAPVASTVTLTLTGTPSTLIPGGSEVSLDDSGEVFVIDADATIGGGGSVNAAATAKETGPIQALATSNWSIDTPVSGWSGVSNALDATVGNDGETDAKLRARALAVLTNAGGTSVDQLRAEILRIANVTECLIIENETQYVDADGRQPHSFEGVVRNGDSQEIADAIWAHKPAGILSGTTVPIGFQESETVVDSNGDNQIVSFSRPESVNVWIEVDYTPNERFPTDQSDGEDTIQQAILDLGQTLQVGDGLNQFDIADSIHTAFAGIRSVFKTLVIRVGLTASPPTAQEVPTSRTQLASIDSSRITITRV